MTTDTDSRSQRDDPADGSRETDETDIETIARTEIRPDCRSLHAGSV